MSGKSSVPADVITLPKSGGVLTGLGEKFSPDQFTGTGNFKIPITDPLGRSVFNRNSSLAFSTGNGNDSFGMGWSLSVPDVSHKTK